MSCQERFSLLAVSRHGSSPNPDTLLNCELVEAAYVLGLLPSLLEYIEGGLKAQPPRSLPVSDTPTS